MAGRPGFIIAGAEVAVGAVALALGFESAALSCAVAGALMLTFACVVQVIANHHERKTNGRYREALEAHRAGTGGSADDGSRAGRGARRGTGAGMNPNYYERAMEELENRHRAILGLPPRGSSSSAPAPAPKPRPAGDFDGKNAEFAAGVVTGTRSFDVDKLGRLTGVTYKSVWMPGENEAECMEREVYAFSQFTTLGPAEPTRSSRGPHSLATCAHGFYGYYEGSNDYYEPGRVMGVVEAYGETVIGTRGFRASKARIVALHLPPELSKSARALVTRNYAGTPLFDSFDAMVAEFPPDDAGHGINPATDPDFWTRKA